MRIRRLVTAALTAATLGMIVTLVPALPAAAAESLDVPTAAAETPGKSYDMKIECPRGASECIGRPFAPRGVAVHFALAPQWLNAGQSWTFGNAHLKMQTDGNLVIYKRGTTSAKWASNTRGSGANRMYFKRDGDLIVVRSGAATAAWTSRTKDRCGVRSTMVIGLQSDSNLVVYCSTTVAELGYIYYKPLWASNTSGI